MPAKGPLFTNQSGLFFSDGDGAGRAAIFRLDGKKVMTMQGNRGRVSFDRIPAGTYIFQSAGKSGNRDVKISVVHQ
jgi:hypothetical protein